MRPIGPLRNRKPKKVKEDPALRLYLSPAQQDRRCKAASWVARTSMSDQHSFMPVDSYSRSKTAEHMLNTAITQAKISESFEEYLELFDKLYTDESEVS